MQGVEIIGLVGIIKFLFDAEQLARKEVIRLTEKPMRAGWAKTHNLILVTHNTKEFMRVEALNLLDWF